jgi:hypothetical protein
MQVVTLLTQLREAAKLISTGATTRPQELVSLCEQSENLEGLSVAVVKSEPVTPINTRLRAALFRPPKTLKSFFGPKTAESCATKSEAGVHASAAAAGSVATKGRISSSSIRDSRTRAPLKRPASHCTKVVGGVIDLCDTPVKDKVPKVDPVHSSPAVVGLKECLKNEASIADEHISGAEDAQMATEFDATECRSSGCAPTVGPEGLKQGMVAVAKESCEVKQILAEKPQNGPEQKDCTEQTVSGAAWAVQPQQQRKETESDLEQVLAMGFDRTKSMIALKTCGGDANRAIEFLLNR